ncbi:MAG: carbonic anhydrase family protein [Vitreoscilla sp.]|nr:carbonic anhydrase family protein [Vitreoscilla sp.]
MRSLPQPYALTTLALVASLSLQAFANGGGHDAAPAAVAKPAVPSKESLREEAKAAKAGATDPMDALRQKLAERLGASKPADSRSPNVMRVVGKSAEAADAHGARATVSKHAAPKPHGAAAGHGPSPAAAGLHPGAHDTHWDYVGENGPEAWGKMKPEFGTCATGQRQSPIDIRDGIAVQLQPIEFEYHASSFSVIDNGHTIQVNLGAGNAISVGGKRFDLLQFHFHRPSEERINGRQFDMVVHMVHKDPEGKLAVVAVLLDRGSAQPVIQTVWNALPLEKGEAVPAPTQIDVAQLLPEDRRYYTYMGSLTTPPCSEGVLWMVMKQPVALSPSQIGIFARLYPMNARPIQKVSGRMIKESN